MSRRNVVDVDNIYDFFVKSGLKTCAFFAQKTWSRKNKINIQKPEKRRKISKSAK